MPTCVCCYQAGPNVSLSVSVVAEESLSESDSIFIVFSVID